MNKQVRKHVTEERWHGLGVSDGRVVGRVLRIHNGARQVYRATLDDADVERECRRFRAAVRAARGELLAIKTRAEKELGADHAYIFDAHILMLEDRKLIDEIESFIRLENANAEWAVKVAVDRLLAVYAEIKDDYLRARGSDIEDVSQRIMAALSGDSASYRKLTRDAVIVATDLPPSRVAELDIAHARAFATDAGGWTSHTAIIARGLGIPAVVALRDLHDQARTGDVIIVDARTGDVILHPTEETIASYRALQTTDRPPVSTRLAQAENDAAEPPPTFRTLDGTEIVLRANVELPAEFGNVRKFRARGIGLYRSEFLLTGGGRVPSEEAQCQAYIDVAQSAGDGGATVRLFDLGGDKVGTGTAASERNPALGLRAIRFGLTHGEILRTQVRAILRAAAQVSGLSIVLPMIADAHDVRSARAIINQEMANLEGEGIEARAVPVGAMIEVPSAVWMAGQLAHEVDFFSLGTNDLVQYLLAVDRGNEAVSHWFRSLHPAVLHSIRSALRAAQSAGIPAMVCGEMAATPAYAVMLIGLGATELSMNATAIPRVSRVISGINIDDARTIAGKCLGCPTADDVEEIVRVEYSARWPHLFSPESLPPPKTEE